MKSDFDIAAKHYDTVFTHTKIGNAQRKKVYHYIDKTVNIKSKLSILELNCGTGEDAIYLSNLAHNVLATDISEAMINRAKNKTDLPNLSFKILDIAKLSKTNFNTQFDLIFSNFGGFNCLDSKAIETFFNDAKTILKPNGKIVLVIMPKHCIWEQLYFRLKRQLKNANRRQTNTFAVANVDGVAVKTWYYNPSDISILSQRTCNIKKIRPVGLFIPPSYLNQSLLTKKFIFKILEGLDQIFTASFWAKYADHYYIELQLQS